MVCACLCHRRVVFFFFLRLSLMRPLQNNEKTSVLSLNSRYLCGASSLTVVFPFDGVAFHEAGCGSAFLSATQTLRTQAAQLTSVAFSSSSAPCL